MKHLRKILKISFFFSILFISATQTFAQNAPGKAANGKQFLVDGDIPWQDLGGGLKRKIIY